MQTGVMLLISNYRGWRAKCYFIREQVSNETIELIYGPTQEMVANMFTKALAQPQIYIFCKKEFQASRVW